MPARKREILPLIGDFGGERGKLGNRQTAAGLQCLHAAGVVVDFGNQLFASGRGLKRLGGGAYLFGCRKKRFQLQPEKARSARREAGAKVPSSGWKFKSASFASHSCAGSVDS